MKLIEIVAIGLLVAAGNAAAQQLEHFRVEKVNDHVYAFISWDPTLELVDGNSYAILTDDGVVVVDAHHVPILSEANIAEIRKLTDKPIRYLLNTHWHGDHNTSNWVYQKAFPDIQIIAQTSTREILGRRMAGWIKEAHDGEWEQYVKDFQKLIDTDKDERGKPLTAERKDRIQRLLALLQRYKDDSRRSVAVLPNTTFDRSLTLYLGGREIQIRHDFRANTPGDAYVWLPQDSILITGDILVHPIPYCFGSFFDEWVLQLDSMLTLHPKLILPGHGEILHDTLYLATVRNMFADLVAKTKAAYASGVTSVDSITAKVDLSPWREKLAGDDYNRGYAFDLFVTYPSARRMLKILKNELGVDTLAN